MYLSCFRRAVKVDTDAPPVAPMAVATASEGSEGGIIY